MNHDRNGELPRGWAIATIPELIGQAGVFTDGDWVETKDQDPDGNVRLIQLADVGDGVFRDRSARFLTASTAAELSCTYLERGDVLVARMPDPLGRACIFPGVGQDAVTVVDVCVVRPGPASVNARWLAHSINASGLREQVAQYESGSTRKRISRKNLGKVRVPVPPLPEQHRIVDKIEELFSDLDAGEAALEKTERLLERYRQSVLKAAVEGELTREWREQNPDVEPADDLLERILEERRARWEADQRAKYEAKGKKPPAGWKDRYKPPVEPAISNLPELPGGWRWVSMDALAWDSGYGTSTKCRYENSGPPVLRIPNILDGRIALTDMKFAADEDSTGNTAKLAPRDLLIIRTNGSANLIGRAALVERELVEAHYFASYLIRYRLCENVAAAWIKINWQAPALRRLIVSEAASSAGQFNISLSAIDGFANPLPPLAEQEAIVEEVERRLSVVDAVAAEVERQRGRAKQLRRAILQHAFEGRLVPQNPDDEPAEVLLERIRWERNGKAKTAKKRGRKAKERVEEVR